jgi:hypothetical protein
MLSAPRTDFGQLLGRCDAAFALLTFVHGAVFHRLNRRSADFSAFCGTSKNSRFTRRTIFTASRAVN